jgi:glycosyltransferase involved in cell wall biosynthesis
MSGWVARRIQESLGVPFVMTFHALGLVRLRHQKSADAFPEERIDIEREIVEHADAIVPECPQDKRDLARLYGADVKRMRMVPCGFDPLEFSPMKRSEARAALGLSPHEFIVLQLGRIVPRKGIDNVIRSIAELPAEVPARLLVVGGESSAGEQVWTPEAKRLREIATAVGVADRVTFTGHRDRSQLRAYYAAADTFVTTPWYEPFGITPLEAMACGTPVVGSAVGGIKYSVQDGVTGFLVPPRNPTALAAKLAYLQANPLVARAMGLAGLQRARSMFTWERVARELADVYAHVGRRSQLAAAGARARPRLAASRTTASP